MDKTFGKVTQTKLIGDGYRFTATAELYAIGNQKPHFSITGEMARKNGRVEACGCLHDEVKEHFPKLAEYLKWHLVSTDGPTHYIANTLYHAGDRDCWGGRKGEVRWYRYNVRACGALVFDKPENKTHELPDEKEAKAMAERLNGEIVLVPWMFYEGKERDFDAARSTAVWPDATDEQLSLPKDELQALLESRLPELMVQFRADMVALFGPDIEKAFAE